MPTEIKSPFPDALVLRSPVSMLLHEFDACFMGLDWSNDCETLAEAWEKCNRSDWMIWLLRQVVEPRRYRKLLSDHYRLYSSDKTITYCDALRKILPPRDLVLMVRKHIPSSSLRRHAAALRVPHDPSLKASSLGKRLRGLFRRMLKR